MWGSFILLALSLSLPPARELRAELLARNLPLPRDAADLDHPITSYAVLDDPAGFVIAYYTVEPDGLLHELRIRAHDKQTRAWRMMTRVEPIGSVLSVKRNGQFLYVGGHSSPSAAPLLVLTEDLKIVRELDGWPVLMLDGGRVVFSRSMVHFAPVHAQSLAVFDPRSGREDALYPAADVVNERGVERLPQPDQLMERSIQDVRKGKTAGTIAFTAVEQHMRLDPQQAAKPASIERRRHMSCSVRVTPPVCRAER